MSVMTESTAQNLSAMRMLTGIFDKPVAVFNSLLTGRRWWGWFVPLLALILAFAVMSVLNVPYAQELAREQAELRLAELPAAQAAEARSTLDTTLSFPVMLASTLGVGIIALVIGLVAQATFLYFGALVTGGDDMEFGAVFAMSAWTRIPLAVGLLVQAAFLAITQQGIRYPGLAFLVATGDLMQDAKNPLVPLLSKFEPFWVWHLVLVGIGVAVVARFGPAKSFSLTLIYALLTLAFAALPTFLFSGMM